MAKQNYFDDTEFLEHWRVWRKARLAYEAEDSPYPRTPERIGEMLIEIAEHLRRSKRFANLGEAGRDVAADGLLRMVMALPKYDSSKGKPFTFFSRVCINAMLNSIEKRAAYQRAIARFAESVHAA